MTGIAANTNRWSVSCKLLDFSPWKSSPACWKFSLPLPNIYVCDIFVCVHIYIFTEKKRHIVFVFIYVCVPTCVAACLLFLCLSHILL